MNLDSKPFHLLLLPLSRPFTDPRGSVNRVRVPRTAEMDAPCFVNFRVLGGTHKYTMGNTVPNAHADVDAHVGPITRPCHHATPHREASLEKGFPGFCFGGL